ncbi:MAG TPA: DEAD/DEAH box helicase family protein [Chitinolyticbacter sp.]|nr:DEAD/DEAH box helicase family protein [Chitinolyticbacter sp.]
MTADSVVAEQPALATAGMKALHFRHSWRPYQQRILDAVDRHLSDDRLHVVAAPGSGKTTLGLEVMRRLGKPTLILSPTRTIRDQWLSRLADFLPAGAPLPDWLSNGLDAPGLVTSITYQALHTRHRQAEAAAPADPEEEVEQADDALSGEEIASLVPQLHAAGIRTLLLDEAHHLRAQWWKALNQLVESLPGLTVVSLTATPPYDAIGPEWERYRQLCGTIDEEISVPELVKAGTLCPHQDYVWTVRPHLTETAQVRAYEAAVQTLLDTLALDDVLLHGVLQHPWLTATIVDEDALLDEPELGVALLSYLVLRNRELPIGLMHTLDFTPADLPPLDRASWQCLLKAYLFDKDWLLDDAGQSHRKTLASRMRAEQLLWRQELRLLQSRLVKAHLTLSSAKIGACLEIHRAERQLRGDQLRQVILTDFIRDGVHGDTPPLGAWPVFHHLAAQTDATDLALLTGRLVVVSGHLLPVLATLNPAPRYTATPLSPTSAYVRLDGDHAQLVQALTVLLQAGHIRTLVGTRSLLGEGWDAPAVNSLILASFAGSFMLTNQMRGRAIRIDRAQPDKVASIWHIVAMEPHLASGQFDQDELASRFSTFVGLHQSKPVIESGLARLELPRLKSERDSNQAMLKRLRQIDHLKSRWDQAISTGEVARIIPTLETGSPPRLAPVWFFRTLSYLLLQAVVIAAVIVYFTLLGSVFSGNLAPGLILLLGAAAGSCFVLPRLAKAAMLWWRHLPIDGSVAQIAQALRDAMCECGQLAGSPAEYPLATYSDSGIVYAALTRGSFYEQALFADNLEQLLSPLASPRYLITRHGRGLRTGQSDFHAVPASLGARKEHAEVLLRHWQRRVSPGELIHARGPEGRKRLLYARSHAFANAMAPRPRRQDRWQ